jgi:hypothetical protein
MTYMDHREKGATGELVVQGKFPLSENEFKH